MVGNDIKRVAVLGAGEMGHGITEVVAIAGYDVTMRDIDQDVLDDGYDSLQWSLEKLADNEHLDEDIDDIVSRIDVTTDLGSAVAGVDMIIEAIPENLELKREVYRELDERTPPYAILASNTSSLRITKIAEATDHPERVIGLHFFNPVVRMELVEVVHGERTSDDVAAAATDFVESVGKTPIAVKKDVRGFVVNNILGPFIDEPAWMVSDGDATVQEADAAMVHQRGYSMGPFELSDLTGVDVNYHVRKEADTPIPPIMEQKVENGQIGRKVGQGYYEYETGDGPNYEPGDGGTFDTLRVEARMINEAAKLVGNGVATPTDIDTGVRLGASFPEGITRRGDEIGLDTVLATLETLFEETGADRFSPNEYLVGLVNSERTGKTSGVGFHTYSDHGAPGDLSSLHHERTDDGRLEIKLANPDRLNALSAEMKEGIEDVLSSVDPADVRCVVFSGAGDRAFCAGADIDSFGDRKIRDVMTPNPVYEAVNEFPRPTVAMIDGYCLGAGLELALACDLRIATERSEFGFPEIRLGLIPGGGGTQRALRIIGETRTKELIFRGNHVDADTAEEWGLINRSVPVEQFEDTVGEFVDDLLSGPPLGLEVAKTVIQEGADASLGAGNAMESQGFGLLFGTDDADEGTSAFLEKRDPDFEGK